MNCNTNLRMAIAAVLGTVSVSGLAYANDVPPTLADASSSALCRCTSPAPRRRRRRFSARLKPISAAASPTRLVVSSVGNTNFGAVSCTPASRRCRCRWQHLLHGVLSLRRRLGDGRSALGQQHQRRNAGFGPQQPDRLQHRHRRHRLRHLHRDGQRLQLRQRDDRHLHRRREREERSTGHHGRGTAPLSPRPTITRRRIPRLRGVRKIRPAVPLCRPRACSMRCMAST